MKKQEMMIEDDVDVENENKTIEINTIQLSHLLKTLSNDFREDRRHNITDIL